MESKNQQLIVANNFEIPYGPLSNGFNVRFNYNNNDWDSVVSYFSNINGTQYDIRFPYGSSWDALWSHLEKELMNKAIQNGIRARSISDKNFDGALIKCIGKEIKYVSTNQYLGVDLYNLIGENIYGKWLNNYKNIISNDSFEVYYDLYTLNRYLNTAINYEPLDNYLELARGGAGVRYLNSVLAKKYQNVIDIPSQEIVAKTREISKAALPNNPEEMIINTMKNKIRSVRVNNTKSYQYKIFYKFVEGVFRKKNIKVNVLQFLNLMKPDVLWSNAADIFNKVESRGWLNNIVPDIYIPSEEYIKNVEENLEYQGITIPGNMDVTAIKGDNYALIDEASSILSMKYQEFPFSINGALFPSIYHYMIYMVGTIIPGFNSYDLINKNGSFVSANEANNNLLAALNKYKSDLLEKNMPMILQNKFFQNPPLIELLKTTGPEYVIVTDFEPNITSRVINSIKNDVKWEDILSYRGNVIDICDTDMFFVFQQHQMLYHFVDILKKVFGANILDLQTVKKTYKAFYRDNVSSILSPDDTIITELQNDPRRSNVTTIKTGLRNINYDLSDDSCMYLRRAFLTRFLMAEKLSKRLFKIDANPHISFLTKFTLVDSQNRIKNGETKSSNLVYDKGTLSKYILAMARVVKAIGECTKSNVITNVMVDKAYFILTYNNSPYQNKFEVEQNIPKIINSVEVEPTDPEVPEAVNVFEDDQDAFDFGYGSPVMDEDEYNIQEEDLEDEENAVQEGDDIDYEDEDEEMLYENDYMGAPYVNILTSKFVNDVLVSMKASKSVIEHFKNRSYSLVGNIYTNEYKVNMYQ